MRKYSQEEKIHFINRINEMQKVVHKLKNENDREPTNTEIADAMNVPVEKVIELNNILNDLNKQDEELELEDNKNYKYASSNEIIIEDLEDYNNTRKIIQENAAILKEKEKQALFLRFGIDSNVNCTMEEIAQKLNISPSMVKVYIARGLRIVNNPEKYKKRRELISNIKKNIKDNG